MGARSQREAVLGSWCRGLFLTPVFWQGHASSIRYQVELGDGVQAIYQNLTLLDQPVQHRYQQPGIYKVTVQAENAAGQDHATIYVQVTGGCWRGTRPGKPDQGGPEQGDQTRGTRPGGPAPPLRPSGYPGALQAPPPYPAQGFSQLKAVCSVCQSLSRRCTWRWSRWSGGTRR